MCEAGEEKDCGYESFELLHRLTLLCSFTPSQTLALSINPDHLARQLPNHHGIAKKKRGANVKRCKPNSSSPASQPTGYSSPAPQPTSTPKENPSSSSTQPPTTVVSPTSTPTYTPTGRGKVGIAWNFGDDKRLALITASTRVSIIHLWSAYIPTTVAAAGSSGIAISIMLWGNTPDYIDSFAKLAQPGYATHAYGPNEVNQYDQANLDVDTTIHLWFTYIQPLADKGYTLGGPVTTSAPDGFTWMTDFVNKCGADCKMSEMPLHFYDTTFEKLEAYVEKWSAFKIPMRLTEYACTNFNGPDQPDLGQVWDFTVKAINYFENNPQVLSYAPYGWFESMGNVDPNNQLFDPNNKDTLSALGWRYINGY